MFCGAVMLDDANLPDPNEFSSWDDLVKETKNRLHGAGDHTPNIAQWYIDSERHLLQQTQSESFPEECNALKTNKPKE